MPTIPTQTPVHLQESNVGVFAAHRICEDGFSIARRVETPLDATGGPCWVEPGVAGSSIRPRLEKARSTRPGPAMSGVVAWRSGSARAAGVAEPVSSGASSGGISARQQPGGARESANEPCRRGFRGTSRKPSAFTPGAVFASDNPQALLGEQGVLTEDLRRMAWQVLGKIWHRPRLLWRFLRNQAPPNDFGET
jgi:hypothetical protein